MLFRRFMLVSTFIALGGMGLLTLIQATHPQNGGFKVQNRLQQWKKYDVERACKADQQHCTLVRFTYAPV